MLVAPAKAKKIELPKPIPQPKAEAVKVAANIDYDGFVSNMKCRVESEDNIDTITCEF